MQIAVNVQGQGVAVFFHQGLQPRVIAAQILAVQALIAGHSVHFLFADAKMQRGIRQVLVLPDTIHHIRISEETQGAGEE